MTLKTIYAKIKEIGYTGSESLIKRTMYGRCNFNILKNKIRLSMEKTISIVLFIRVFHLII